MGNHRGLRLHLSSECAFLFAGATYTSTCLGDGNTSFTICSEKERLALLKSKTVLKILLECCHHGLAMTVAGGQESSVTLSLEMWKAFILEEMKPTCMLTYLNLSHAGFDGIIPPHIGNLSNLKVLDLSSNYKLIADDMAWTSGLSSLEHLVLSSVDLGRAQNTGMVFYMIPLLKELSLSDCGLSNANVGPFLNSSRILPNIKHLDLGFNSFQGPLPGFFQNMSSLKFLDLSEFNVSLSWNFANLLNLIPSLSELHLSRCGLGKEHLSSHRLNSSTLSNIQHLVLSENLIEGTFPSVFTNMSSLGVLDLSGNKLNSSVPIMPNLLDLDLSHNQFKQIEDIGIWRQCHIKQLHASGNDFQIEMIDSPKNLSECSQYALEWLDLSSSPNGTIPEPLGRLANLRGIDLSSSRLTGPIPEFVGRLRYLQVLDLSENQLTGPIPTFLGNLSIIDLSLNQLNSSIPESFGNVAALSYLDLSFNRLTGPIPASLGRLVSLRAILLGSNFLNGTIPVSFGQLSKLRSLNLYNNSLEGVVSEAHFANLSMLEALDASFNPKLTFNVSCDWIPPFQLADLRLSSCAIGTEFPQWLQSQRNLDALDLSNATISGPLPRWLRKILIIRYLDLSHNKLSGPLTNLPNGATYRGYGYVPLLLLENNFFNESIPRSICRRTNLKFLDLSRNRLTGKVPKCLENLHMFLTMILGSNQLSGDIPSFVGLNSLQTLKLNDNNFVGEPPRTLGNLQYLGILDAGDNKLSGNIPEWVGEKLTYLIVLRLHRNNFTGKIPESLCKAVNLHILDVAHNYLKGAIPSCLGELIAMVNSNFGVIDDSPAYEMEVDDYEEYVDQVMKGVDLEYTKTWRMVYNMDLSSNQLVGEIPVELTALSNLVGLNLSNNHLSGGIPDIIGSMMKLESLDLSRNELTGGIPPSMAALTFLSRLNLSHNNLSGRIPTGRQLQTLIDPSIYEGNKDLCGPPLPKNCSNPGEDPTTTTTSKKKHKTTDEQSKVWLFYMDIMSGFAIGFWGVIGLLLFKKHWRQKLFMFSEEMMDKIYVAILIRVSMIKRGREAT